MEGLQRVGKESCRTLGQLLYELLAKKFLGQIYVLQKNTRRQWGSIGLKDGLIVTAHRGEHTGEEALQNLLGLALVDQDNLDCIEVPERTDLLKENLHWSFTDFTKFVEIEKKRVKELISLRPPDHLKLRINKNKLQSLTLKVSDWEFLALVDEVKTVKKIFTLAQVSEHEFFVLKKIIYFRKAGLIQVSDTIPSN